MSVAAQIPEPEMASDVLDMGVSLARDLAEQVFTLCCAQAGVSQAEQDRLFDCAEEILAGAVRDLLDALGFADVWACRNAVTCASDAFAARILDLCETARGCGGDLAQ